jgi:hypothetical protein
LEISFGEKQLPSGSPPFPQKGVFLVKKGGETAGSLILIGKNNLRILAAAIFVFRCQEENCMAIFPPVI